MNTKLTLNIDEFVITKAKSYAKKNSTSLSKLIENYLTSLNQQKTEKLRVSPLVESLTGVLSDDKKSSAKEYVDFLNEKYL